MTWPRAAQRVLLVVAAGLLALGVALGATANRRSPRVPAADDPALVIRLDLNTASAADLETLPGIGAVLARRIEDHRLRHGPFRRVEDLALVPGVGERSLAALRPLLEIR